MKIRSITLENVRRFTAATGIHGIGDGLNLLCEPNEHGKSTLFDAVQALFFKPHGSRDKEIMALRPHAGGAPAVTVEVETADGRFALTKRWLSKPVAEVTQGGRLVAQSDEAEAWIARLLGGGEGGPSGLVWVRQGLTGLGGGSRKEQEASYAARQDLMTSVGQEVEAMTGGRRMDQALARCRDEVAEYATGTGRPRTGGPWKAAQDRVERLSADHAELAATAAALREALDARRRWRRELAELEAPETAAARRDRLDEAARAHAAAARHAEEVEAEARKVDAARLAVTGAQGRLETLRGALAEHEAATAEAREASDRVAKAVAAQETAAQALDLAQRALDAAKAAQKSADQERQDAQRRQAARHGAARRTQLAEDIARAETARTAMEDAAAAARHGPDGRTLRGLEALAADLATAIAARDGAATQIVMSYAPGRDGSVQLDGAPLLGGRPVAVPRSARLTIDGVGDLDVRPSAAGQDDAGVDAADRALRQALGAAGAADLDAARRAAEARAEAERRHGEARAVFATLAPKGIEPLRMALAAIPEAAGDADGPDLPEAEAALSAAEDARVAAQAARDAAAERQSDARSAAARAEAASTGATDRLRRAAVALERLGPVTIEALTAEFQRAGVDLQAAEALHRERSRSAPDLAAAEAALKRARLVEDEARATVSRLRPEIAKLDERIARSSGDAVEERLAETAQELSAAGADLERIEHEVAVLRRLQEALESAKKESRELYFAPVATELKPLLHLLWPEAELTWGQDTLLPNGLIRDGAEEPIEILSGGTQEQIALLVRLAFARMLARAGRHAPVILDDALVFTDDDRIDRMFDALHRQAGDLQILVLSCRQRAFRDLGARVLRLGSPETVA